MFVCWCAAGWGAGAIVERRRGGHVERWEWMLYYQGDVSITTSTDRCFQAVRGKSRGADASGASTVACELVPGLMLREHIIVDSDLVRCGISFLQFLLGLSVLPHIRYTTTHSLAISRVRKSSNTQEHSSWIRVSFLGVQVVGELGGSALVLFSW